MNRGIMNLKIAPKKSRHLAPTPILQQTAFWDRLKKKQGRKTIAFDILLKSGEPPADGIGPCTDMLVVMRPINAAAQMAYVPFGPELLPDEERRGRWLEQLSERLRPHLPENCLFIRYDLPWKSPWCEDKNRYTKDHHWMGAPKVRVREMRMNFDTKRWNLRKAPTDLLPPDTVIVNLHADRDHILKNMKPKTRYNIRVSARKGISVREGGISDLGAWYDLYCETAARHGMAVNDLDYFRAALEVRSTDTNSPAKVHLLLAEANGRPAAGIMLVLAGKRATYLYGASSSKYSHLMASYALQWKAICMARKAGCRDYDLFGISPTPDPCHRMYGLYRFKTGFGGRLVHRQGCWDYPLDPEKYEAYRAFELASPGLIS